MQTICQVIPQPRTAFLVYQKCFGQKGVWVMFRLEQNQHQDEYHSSRVEGNQAELIGLAFSVLKLVVQAKVAQAKSYYRAQLCPIVRCFRLQSKQAPS
jgi:hypothetical protein